MNQKLKIVVYAVLIFSATIFGMRFYGNYSVLMQDAKPGDDDLKNVTVPMAKETPPVTRNYSRMLLYGAAFFFSVLSLGLLTGHDLSHLLGEKFGKMLFNDEGETIKQTDYEQAEETWANGQHLEAIQLMRNHLQQNPQEQHVALRIAEIYEKDLQNPLAAALEYEEVLQHKLASEQWGWTAIHLCNLYGKLNQSEKAVALLHRIVNEYGKTEAAVKARKRLELPEPTESDESSSEELSDAGPVKARPPRPDNTDLQKQLDRFHHRNFPNTPSNS